MWCMTGHASNGNPTAKKDWLCNKCVGADGSPFRVFGSKMQCFKCHRHKGQCHAKDVPIPPPRAKARAGRVGQGGDGGNASSIYEVRKLQRELRESEERFRKLEAANLARSEEATQEEGGGGTSDDAEDLDQLISAAKGDVKHLSAREVEGTKQALEDARKRLAELEERKRQGLPLHQQLGRLAGRIKAKKAVVEAIESKRIPEIETDIGKLQAQLLEQRTKLEEAKKELSEMQALYDQRGTAMAEEQEQGITDPVGTLIKLFNGAGDVLKQPQCTGDLAQSIKKALESMLSMLAEEQSKIVAQQAAQQAVPQPVQQAQQAAGTTPEDLDDDVHMLDAELDAMSPEETAELDLVANKLDSSGLMDLGDDPAVDDPDGGPSDAKRRRKRLGVLAYRKQQLRPCSKLGVRGKPSTTSQA